jgi:trk system potassium uptake protein TrkH
MLLKPTLDDARRIAVDLGRILAVVAVAGLVPLLWAIAAREWKPAADLLLMVGVAALLAGIAESWHPRTKAQPVWGHGLIVVSLVWLVVPAVGSIPLMLSGHYADLLDAYFDAMSGLTTTGLATIQDLDHLASSTNVWRHALQFLGGQGIVLAALVFFSASGALSLYEAEGRDQRIFPSVGSTARFIWLVSLVHGILGVSALTIDGVVAQGFEWSRSLFHGFTIFMAAFDTGGFSPQSTSIGYYHSASFEAVVAVLMLAGALSFGLHHAIWQRRAGLLKNIEVRTFATTVSVTLLVTLTGLAVGGIYTGTSPLLRRGFFQLLSAHTGTGFATVSTGELARWSGLAFAGMTVAMALGGMSSSTAGGVKALRIGLTVKSVMMTVREALTPSRTVVSRTYFQYGRHRLEPELAGSVMAVSLLYVALYLLGAAVGLAYGYGLAESLFESVSAAAAVGLSVGVVSPDMPVVLQIIMILQMWIGRLEFIAVFALLGFGLSVVRGR